MYAHFCQSVLRVYQDTFFENGIIHTDNLYLTA